jgi:hypothetical protein
MGKEKRVLNLAIEGKRDGNDCLVDIKVVDGDEPEKNLWLGVRTANRGRQYELVVGLKDLMNAVDVLKSQMTIDDFLPTDQGEFGDDHLEAGDFTPPEKEGG